MEPVRNPNPATRSPTSAQAAPRTSTRPATHHAAVITAPGRIDFQQVPRPEPGADEVRARLEGCGISASSLPIWEGRNGAQYPLPPGAPGHEGWGTVDAVGRNVRTVQPGERVTLLSHRALAEYDVAPADAIVRLPESLKHHPVPGEPLGCAMNILTRSAIRPGQIVAVVGAGFLGSLLISLAREAGARVIAISQRPFSRQVAAQRGADEGLPLDDPNAAIDRIRQLTQGNGCQRVIETTGLQQPLDLAAELVGVRGRLVIAGSHRDGKRRVNLQTWNARGIDVINAHERDTAIHADGIRRALDAIQRNRFDPFPLLSHRFAFSNLAEAFDTALLRPSGFIKGWVQIAEAANHNAHRPPAPGEGTPTTPPNKPAGGP